MSRATRADMKDYKVIFTFRILHDGWEMDNDAWVALNEKGERVLLMTNHGSLYDHGRDISKLHEKLEQTRNSLRGIKKAINLVNTNIR